MHSSLLGRWWVTVMGIAATAMFLMAVTAPSASAYTYVSENIDDLTVTSTNSSLGGTGTVTLTFTWPDASWSTSDYLYLYTPYMYSYSGGSYNYDNVEIDGATISSSQLTLSSQSTTYASFYPKATLSNGSTVTITLTGVENPDSIEGTGNWSISGWKSSSDTYYSVWGSGSQVFGTVDLTVTVKDANGTTPVSGANVSLSYYNSSNWSDYYYTYGYTNSSGVVQFAGMPGSSSSPKTFTVYFYYNGDSASGDAPSSTTLTYSGTDSAPSYNFVTKNLTTHFKDGSTPINNAYWYFYKTSYTNYTSDYVWRWGYTDSTGKISGAAQVDGSYTLYVQDPSSTSYTYYPYDFTVSGGVVSGLSDPITIPTPEVTGTLKAGTSGASSVYMYIHNSNWTVYQSAYTDSNGNFEFALNKNCSSCKVEVSSWGLPSGYFAPTAEEVNVTKGVANSAMTLNLVAATKTISGTVTMNGDDVAKVAAGTPVSNAYVSCYQSSGTYNYANTTTDTSGAFTLTVVGGKWKCYLWPQTWPATWAYVDGEFNPSFNDDSTMETASYNLKVDPFNSYINGKITYPDGTAVGASAVYIYSSGGKKDSATKSVYAYDYTDSNGEFSLNTTEGTHDLYMYFYSSSGANNYVAPSVDAVTLDAGETVDLGTLTLVEKNSHLQGTVSVSSTGAGVNNISVYAWKQKGSYDWASATTDSSGKFDLTVSPGDWTVSIYVWNLTSNTGEKYIYAGGSLTATVADSETVTGQDFVLTIADSVANFVAQDTSGNAMDEEYGWASITESDNQGAYGWYSIGCYVSRGSCQVDVTSGVEYSVNYYSYSNWGWYDDDTDTYSFSAIKVDGVAADSFTTAADETQDVVLVMAKNDATLQVGFEDKDGNAVEINGNIYASNDTGGWAYKYVYGESSATMKLSAGTWNINYWTWGDWMSYDDKTADKTVEAVSNETTDVTFVVLESDATVSGVVNDPDGNPVTSPTFIKLSTSFGTNQTETEDAYGLIEQTGYTDSEGKFSFDVPSGKYYISASSTEYLDTEPAIITADTEDSAVGLVLQFVSPDAIISGTVIDGIGIDVNNARTLAIGDGVAGAFISAFSNKGSARTAETDETGAFEIEAVQGQTWYIMAVFESEGVARYSQLAAIEVDEASEVVNITLDQSITLPEPQSLQFDPSTAGVIQLENGVELNMPASSVVADDTVDQVTVTVTPTFELAQEASSKPLSTGYEITATEDDGDPVTELASDVTLTIPYDEDDLETAGIEEEDLQVGYYDSTAEDWSNVSSVVVDTEANNFTVTTDHFSQFAIVSGRSIASADNDNSGGDTGDDETIDILKAPTGVQVNKRRAKTVTIAWNAVTDAASYEVGVYNAKNGKRIKTVAASNTKRLVKKLTSNKKYQFRVRSVGGSGTRSGWSAIKAGRTLPNAPQGLKVGSVSITGSVEASATLRWNKPRGTVKKYVVTIYNADGSVYDTLTTNKRTLTATGLSRGTTYAFSVKARFNKKNASAASNRKSFNTPNGL